MGTQGTRGAAPATVADLVAARQGDHRPGLLFENSRWSHHEVAAQAAARAALLADLLPRGAEPHVGVLLDNTPEYPRWLAAAALAGAAVAGINPTRRGAELARDILHTECRIVITERAKLPLLDGLDLPGVRLLTTDTQEYADLLKPYENTLPADVKPLTPPTPGTRLLLYFTSGSTGAPKAAICTQGRLAAAGRSLMTFFGVHENDTHYICMPMFHGNAVIADWSPALAAGASVALRRRFSATSFLDDVRTYKATYFTYVGRAIEYILATPPRPEDRDHRLRTGFGTEAGAVDAARFADRFGVRLVEGYGSSEGGAAIQRTAGTPEGAIGRAAPGDDLAVVDPETFEECPPAHFAPTGRLLNGSSAIGELVNRGRSPFEGYWRNEAADAARLRGGWYWTGDLFYRDTEGYLYFAGRSEDRIRVDSENLATAMIETILARYAPAASVAVYAVPDPVAGDQVMATLALRAGATPQPFDPTDFTEFLATQPDLGPKMIPRFLRITPRMPVTATNKVHRASLRREGFRCPDDLWWRPSDTLEYVPLNPTDVTTLLARYREHGRDQLLDR